MAEQASGSGAASAVMIVVMGVSACGKSAVGTLLARTLGCAFIDGDDLHPASNVAKMRGGSPLTDADRAPWLDRIGAVLADRASHPAGIVIACSALRRAYRNRIRARAGAGLTFVFLDITIEAARRRIAARKGHFMPPSLVDSQFATLERPDAEADVVTIGGEADIDTTAQEAAAAITRRR